MTLTVRNRFFVSLLACFLAALTVMLVLLCAAFMQKTLTPPPKIYTGSAAPVPLFSYSFRAVVLSIIFFILYAPVCTALIYRNFEKTQSTEILFFSGFLIGCMSEGLRLFIPLFDLWRSLSPLLVLTGRAVFFGRLLCPLSFLFSSVMSVKEQRTDIERNFIIMLVVVILFATIVPLDTTSPTGHCTVSWGYPLLFVLVRALIFSASTVSLFITARQQENRELLFAAVGFTVLVTGYIVLTLTDNYVALTVGMLLLVSGTYEYLEKIHNLYLWK